MASSPRGRSGTVNKKDIIIYEDETYSEDLGHMEDLDKSISDVDAEEPIKRNSSNIYNNSNYMSIFGNGEKVDDIYSEQQHEVVPGVESQRDSIVRRFNRSESHGRDVSSNTAIHLVTTRSASRESDPFVEDEEREQALEDLYEDDINGEESDEQDDDDSGDEEEDHFDGYDRNNNSRVTSLETDTRKPSDFSILPEEVNPLPFAPTPPNWREQGSYRASISAKTSPGRSANRLQSSPQSPAGRQFSPAAAQAKDGRFVSSPLARQYHSSAFRNPSSVREMQLSSPSPPPALHHTPRSARQRRLDQDVINSSPRNGTPSRNPGAQSSRVPSNIGTPMTPSKNANSNMQKEYPLVLLHCSFSAPPLPYSPAVLRAALPEPLQESVMLLREKLGPTVMERGILIPHPQDDYELLEERVLESLELKTPRVGKCGHFIGSDSRKSSGATERRPDNEAVDLSTESGDLHPKCKTCNKHVVDDHRGCMGDNYKRWDLRVYASNGLMRAGAWATAWREMEKVDIEISVWLSEDMRFALERENQLELERDGTDLYYDSEMAGELPGFVHSKADGSGLTSDRSRSIHGRPDTLSASTAACSRTASRSMKQPPRARAHEREPLSTLMLRYLERNVFRRTDLVLHAVIVVLALAFFVQWQGTPVLKDDHGRFGTKISMAIPPAPGTQITESGVPRQAETTSTSSLLSESVDLRTITEWIKPTLSACTFAAGQEAEFGLTAVPADLASKVLQAAETTIIEQEEVPIPTHSTILEGKTPNAES